MKYTLLDYVQYIASSMESDPINSIDDSIESQQIAKVVRTAYFDIIARLNEPAHFTLFNLNASGDNTKPTLMTVPSNISKLIEVRYDKTGFGDTGPTYTRLTYLERGAFFDHIYSLGPTDQYTGSFTHTIDGNSFTVLYVNNQHPNFYTSFDDNTLLFDGFDSAVDTTLAAAKTWCWGQKYIDWSMENAFVPDLTESQQQLLLNEAKSLAWVEMKQTGHSKAEQSARRLWRNSQRSKYTTDAESDFDKLPYFGRK